jgi:hypothetical protein
MDTNCWSRAQLNIANSEQTTTNAATIRNAKAFIELPLPIKAGILAFFAARNTAKSASGTAKEGTYKLGIALTIPNTRKVGADFAATYGPIGEAGCKFWQFVYKPVLRRDYKCIQEQWSVVTGR